MIDVTITTTGGAYLGVCALRSQRSRRAPSGRARRDPDDGARLLLRHHRAVVGAAARLDLLAGGGALLLRLSVLRLLVGGALLERGGGGVERVHGGGVLEGVRLERLRRLALLGGVDLRLHLIRVDEAREVSVGHHRRRQPRRRAVVRA